MCVAISVDFSTEPCKLLRWKPVCGGKQAGYVCQIERRTWRAGVALRCRLTMNTACCRRYTAGNLTLRSGLIYLIGSCFNVTRKKNKKTPNPSSASSETGLHVSALSRNMSVTVQGSSLLGNAALLAPGTRAPPYALTNRAYHCDLKGSKRLFVYFTTTMIWTCFSSKSL